MKLIHEACPEVTALQASKFQRINQEMLSFQSVLSELIDNFNAYFEDLQGKKDLKCKKLKNFYNYVSSRSYLEGQSTASAQLEKEIRHRVRLFQIDAVCF